jgi:orotidine-5'-phosphate decarboxylase
VGAARRARRRARQKARRRLRDVGAVTGATEPEHLARLRELMPATPFLLPGIGAQGGDVAALAPAFAPGRPAGS